MKGFVLTLAGIMAVMVVAMPATVDAGGLGSQVNKAFRQAYGRNPNGSENGYWLGRVVRGEKKTYQALVGAMYYQRARGGAGKSSGKVNGTNTTDKKQLIVDTLKIFVQVYGRDPSNSEKAWWRKRISCGEIKSEKSLRSSMGYHKSKKAGKGADTICGQKGNKGSGGGIIRKSIEGVEEHVMGPQVRIGIVKMSGEVIVTSDGKYQIREGGSTVKATLGKDDQVKIKWEGSRYRVTGPGISFNTKDVVRLVPLNQAVMKVVNFHDKSKTIAGKDYNRFRGVIEVRRSGDGSGMWVVNELRTEYYLRGLAETSGNGPEEYIKALGAAARTYVIYHKVITGGRSKYGDFDIGKTSSDQIYRGYEYEIITPRMSSIFGKTKGILVTDGAGEKPVSTVYFSDSDGRTRSAKEKWGTDRFPHLQQSVKDPYSASSSCKGHCVGMSAQGAYGFASKEGWKMEKILKYYYKGVNLVKAY